MNAMHNINVAIPCICDTSVQCQND